MEHPASLPSMHLPHSAQSLFQGTHNVKVNVEGHTETGKAFARVGLRSIVVSEAGPFRRGGAAVKCSGGARGLILGRRCSH